MVGKRGVDVVLNSLTASEYIESTVRLVALGGRFIEISKRDIWSKEKMSEVRPDIQYSTNSLNEVLANQPRRLLPMLQQLSKSVEQGSVKPLPSEVYEMRGELQKAFERLKAGQVVGKVVIAVQPSFRDAWLLLDPNCTSHGLSLIHI